MNFDDLMRRLEAQCLLTGKRCFLSAEDAAKFRAINRGRHLTEHSIRSFECDCGSWHNTSMPLAAYESLERYRAETDAS